MKLKTTYCLALSFLFCAFTFNVQQKEKSAAENYQLFCANCHGDLVEDFRGRNWTYGSTPALVFKAIKSGYPDDGMPSYRDTLSNDEIDDLVSFLIAESKKAPIVKPRSFIVSSEPVRSEELTYKVETVIDGLGVPWGISFLPNGDMLVTERSGKLHRYRNGEQLHEIKNVPKVVARGQGGLMDVEIHPEFSKNKVVYLSYSKSEHEKGNKSTTAVFRARLVNDRLVDGKDIFIALPYESTRHHFGSRLEFDREGYLYLSVGDRGKRDKNPQSLNNHCGKIHRILDDGKIPHDNPFVNTSGAIKSIYSYGHRNPQGVVMHPVTGEIWSNEHGPRGGDEMNLIEKGKNYGWPVISYGINYSGTKFTDITHKEGMEQPKHYWDPSIGVCGLDFVSGPRYPKWSGDALAGSLRFEYLARLKMKDGRILKEEKLLENAGRLRDVKMGKDGYIYVTVEDPGRVLRIVPID